MVLSDRDLDELWRKAGTYGGKVKESAELVVENERNSFSQVTTTLFNEYRDLKARFEQLEEAYQKLREEQSGHEQLKSDYRKLTGTIFKKNEEIRRLNAEAARLQQELMKRE